MRSPDPQGVHRFCKSPALCRKRTELTYSDHGKHTNMVESYFSRMRRMVRGQHHHVSPQYLHHYANQAAWLEDNRRVENAMLSRVSRQWKGYRQRAA